MATFGKTTIGSRTVNVPANYLVGCGFTCPLDGDITSISLYVGAYSIPGLAKAKIYATGNILVAESSEVTITLGLSWVEFPISLRVNAGERYWLSFFSEVILTYTDDPGEVGQTFAQTDYWQTFPDNPATIQSPTFYDLEVSIYATYTSVSQHLITIESTPISVPVTLDGSLLGNTPQNIAVSDGDHTIDVPQEVTV